MVTIINGDSIIKERLLSQDSINWTLTLNLDNLSLGAYYFYSILSDAQEIRSEAPHRHYLSTFWGNKVELRDQWQMLPYDKVFYTSAFAECIYNSILSPNNIGGLVLSLTALPLPKGFSWIVCGSCQSLGYWNIDRALELKQTAQYEFSTLIPINTLETFEYKFLLRNNKSCEVTWEEGDNRLYKYNFDTETDSVIVHNASPRMAQCLWRGAGVVIPVFSLRSKQSWGVGDFADLRALIDWAAQCKMSAVQILPINDTTNLGTWHDSYPYNSISVFALHPIYADLNSLGTEQMRREYTKVIESLNDLSAIDYERVFTLKTTYLKRCFSEFGHDTLETCDFQNYYIDNEHWLFPYAMFRYFTDSYRDGNFEHWGDYSVYDKAKLVFLLKTCTKAQQVFNYHCYVQYILHNQLLLVRKEARARGVIIKGDIPIGISKNSVPAWVDGRLFHFDGHAGAPPDDFSVRGQNWGFPTYNWEEMSKDNYSWWRKRLKYMNRFFDAYRIDHVLGFFRIWEIPANQIYGVLGHFRPALPLTKKEIEDYGLLFSSELLQPIVYKSDFETDVQQEFKQELLTYLEDCGEYYSIRTNVSCQQQIQKQTSGMVCQYLMDLASEVLFVRDAEFVECYHPRVMANKTKRFKHLSDSQQKIFECLHNDYYYYRHNTFWETEAMKKIPAVIEASKMLPCAEDLGMVPSCVQPVLERLQILSLEIQRMPKECNQRFGNLASNPYLSVSTIATHDMPPLRLWWNENKELAQYFWTEELRMQGVAPNEIDSKTSERIVSAHLASPSMLCLLSLQDWLSVNDELKNPNYADEQINVPSNPNQYWNYRMHLNIEDLKGHSEFTSQLQDLIVRSER